MHPSPGKTVTESLGWAKIPKPGEHRRPNCYAERRAIKTLLRP